MLWKVNISYIFDWKIESKITFIACACLCVWEGGACVCVGVRCVRHIPIFFNRPLPPFLPLNECHIPISPKIGFTFTECMETLAQFPMVKRLADTIWLISG